MKQWTDKIKSKTFIPFVAYRGLWIVDSGSLIISVTRCWDKKNAQIFPKVGHSFFLRVMFLKIAQHTPDIWASFIRIFFTRNLKKIAQSGHTAHYPCCIVGSYLGVPLMNFGLVLSPSYWQDQGWNIFLNGPTPAFSNTQHYKFYNKYIWKNVHPVYSAGIRTHNLQIMSLLP